MSDSENVSIRKQAAVDFVQLVVAGRIDEAYEKHVDMDGKHHNPYFYAGLPALRQAMVENHVQFPNKQIQVQQVLGDGDIVAVHSHIVLKPGDPGISAVHIFRFRDAMIVEMWDIGQPVPTDVPNEDGAF